MNKIKNYLIVKEELEKRIEEYINFKGIYALRILKQQLLNTQKLIESEEKRLGLIRIISREEITLDENIKQISSNIDYDFHLINNIKKEEYQFDIFREDINVFIENKGQNKIFASSINKNKTKISKGELLGYLIPNNVLELESDKQR